MVLAKEKYSLRARDLSQHQATFVPFTAQTRMSGVDLLAARPALVAAGGGRSSVVASDVREIRKGAADAIEKWVVAKGGTDPRRSWRPSFSESPARAARRSSWPKGASVLGVIHLKDIVKGGIRERFAHLRAMGIKTVMITGDNPLTAAAIAAEAGVDDFLAQATPEDKMALIKREQADGKLVAMTGDGTNDAPALAQADVGVAMNTGTQAAKEAGNMVDLDSNPTKLIEIVEIGKQLLITRGALTTFSIANDVAKYFAIIPAMFLATFPLLGALNIMGLRTPQSAILSAVIFNALIIVALVPLALRGIRYRPVGAAALLRRQYSDLRRRRDHRAVHRHQGDRRRDHCARTGVTELRLPIRTPNMRITQNLIVAVLMTVVTTCCSGSIYPLAITGIAQVLFPDQANGQLIERDGGSIGSRLIGQGFSSPGYFRSRPSATAMPATTPRIPPAASSARRTRS